jgi:hypothetical protein
VWRGKDPATGKQVVRVSLSPQPEAPGATAAQRAAAGTGSASAGPALKTRLESLLAKLPPYPHGRLKAVHRRPASVPPPKAECEACGYKVTVPRRFLHLGPPICPMHETPMRELGDWG